VYLHYNGFKKTLAWSYRLANLSSTENNIIILYSYLRLKICLSTLATVVWFYPDPIKWKLEKFCVSKKHNNTILTLIIIFIISFPTHEKFILILNLYYIYIRLSIAPSLYYIIMFSCTVLVHISLKNKMEDWNSVIISNKKINMPIESAIGKRKIYLLSPKIILSKILNHRIQIECV